MLSVLILSDSMSRHCYETVCPDTAMRQYVQTLLSDSMSRHCYETVCPDTAMRQYVQTLLWDSMSRHCYDTVCPDTAIRQYVQTLLSDSMSRHCYQTVCPDTANRQYVQTLLSDSMSRHCYQKFHLCCCDLPKWSSVIQNVLRKNINGGYPYVFGPLKNFCMDLCILLCVGHIYVYLHTATVRWGVYTFPNRLLTSLRTLFCYFLYVAPNREKQRQTTPKNLPRMQRARAIPVAWLGSGSCQNRPKG
jgi:hypothetical protein